jgi:hypothetical protein
MNSAKGNFILLIAVLASGLMLHSQIRPASPVMPIGKAASIKVPLGLPPLVIPAGDPPTAETIALRRLFARSDSLSGSRRFLRLLSWPVTWFRRFQTGLGRSG